jgi:hypothetical protein
LAASNFGRRKQERVLIAVGRDSLAGDETRIVDRFGKAQHLEIALGKIAHGVEIKNLPAVIKERVLGIIARGRTADDHSRVIHTSGSVAARATRVAAKRSEIGHGERKVRVRATETDEQKKDNRKTDFNCFHSDWSV